MSERDVVDVLAGTTLLEGVDPESLEALAARCRRERFVPGEAIWSPGETGTAAHLLLEGRVEIAWRSQPVGRESLQYDTSGEWIGLAYLVEAWEHESAARPQERTEVVTVDRSAFSELFEAGEPSAYALLERATLDLVDDVRDANRRLADVFGRPAETLQTLRRRARD